MFKISGGNLNVTGEGMIESKQGDVFSVTATPRLIIAPRKSLG